MPNTKILYTLTVYLLLLIHSMWQKWLVDELGLTRASRFVWAEKKSTITQIYFLQPWWAQKYLRTHNTLILDRLQQQKTTLGTWPLTVDGWRLEINRTELFGLFLTFSCPVLEVSTVITGEFFLAVAFFNQAVFGRMTMSFLHQRFIAVLSPKLSWSQDRFGSELLNKHGVIKECGW